MLQLQFNSAQLQQTVLSQLEPIELKPKILANSEENYNEVVNNIKNEISTLLNDSNISNSDKIINDIFEAVNTGQYTIVDPDNRLVFSPPVQQRTLCDEIEKAIETPKGDSIEEQAAFLLKLSKRLSELQEKVNTKLSSGLIQKVLELINETEAQLSTQKRRVENLLEKTSFTEDEIANISTLNSNVKSLYDYLLNNS